MKNTNMFNLLDLIAKKKYPITPQPLESNYRKGSKDKELYSKKVRAKNLQLGKELDKLKLPISKQKQIVISKYGEYDENWIENDKDVIKLRDLLKQRSDLRQERIKYTNKNIEELKKLGYTDWVVKDYKINFLVDWNSNDKKGKLEGLTSNQKIIAIGNKTYLKSIIEKTEYREEYTYHIQESKTNLNLWVLVETWQGYYLKKGGEITEQDKKETYKKWKDLVNMSASELKKFMDSDEGKEAGLSKQEADKLGIHYGRESAKWILKMKDTPNSEWTPEMWRWAKRQISFNSRMRGNKGKLYDDKGRKTRKHLSLLIWGHNPEKYEMGGSVLKLKEALKIQQEGSFKDKIEFVKENPEVFMGKFADGGELTLTTEQVENKLGRKLHWWNDDVVSINGVEYKKVFLKPEYKRLYAIGGEVNEENEDLDLSKDFAIRNLFYKYEKQYKDEYNEDNWIKFHYGSERKGGVKALKESLELIGDGEITDKGDKHFMYKEMLNNDSLILVVHASLKKPPYGGMEGYKYSLGVYRNNPRTQQIGGGYGASGIMSIEHTKLLSYDDYDIVHHNRNIISKVCSDIKKYAEKYF